MKQVTARQAVIRSLRLFVPRDRRRLVVAAMFGMAASVLDVVGVMLLGIVAALGSSLIGKSPPPAIVRHVTADVGLGGKSVQSTLAVVALAACAFLVAKSLAAVYINNRILRFLANRQTEISARLTRALLARPLLQIQSRSSHEITYALTDGVTISTLAILGSAVVGLSEFALLSVMAITLLALDPLVTLAAIAFFGLITAFMQSVLGRRVASLGHLASETAVASRSLIQEALGTYREIFVLDRREHYADRVATLRRHNADAAAGTMFYQLLPKYVLEAALVIGALGLAASQFLLTSAASAMGTVTLFLAAGTRVLPSLLRLQQAALNLRGSAGSAAPTYDLVDDFFGGAAGDGFRSVAALRLSSGVHYEEFDGVITVSDVSVIYPGTRQPAVSNMSFVVPAGSSIALVGPSGAGKSTLADVIMGALEPDSGAVTIGGVSPREAIAKWPGSIAYVPQSVFLSDSSVRANVAIGVDEASVDDAAVWRALERAQIADFIRSLPEGLASSVGEYGTRLSGGQRQRLGLARALYTQPHVLVLDEATSALDAETEHAITETLRDLQGEVTLIVIAHRLSTVFSCDRVIYLDHGRLISSGSFNEVRAAVPSLERQAQLSGL